MASYSQLGGAAPIPGYESSWYFDFDYDLASGKDKYFINFTSSDRIQSTGIYEVDQEGLEILVLGADFDAIKTGINLQDTGSSYIYDVDFRDVNANDIYGGAFGFGDGGSRATIGITYIKNVYADGESAPLANYGQSNNDFLRSEEGNEPIYVKYATALNFSDSFIDAKSTVYLMNVTFESAHRALRLWPDQEIIIVNSIITVPEGESFAWLSEGSTLKYYNVLWNGEPDPDPSMLEFAGNGSVIKLNENPLPAISSFFDDEIAKVSFQHSADGVTWQPIAGASFGSTDRPLMGDVRFDVALPDSGEVRAHVLMTDGRQMISGGIAIDSLTEPGTLDLADFGPGASSDDDTTGTDDTTDTGDDTTGTDDRTDIDGALEAYILDVATGERFRLDTTTNLSADELAGRDLSILVEARPGSVLDGLIESVEMTLGEISRIESFEPYALFGDRGVDDVWGGLILDDGQYHLEVALYTEDYADGTMIGSLDYTLNITGGTSDDTADTDDTDGPPVSLFLVDTDTGSVLLEVTDGMVLDQSFLIERDVTFVAKVDSHSDVGAEAESVRFNYDDGLIKANENIEPYALFGDRGGKNYKSGDFSLTEGTHEMTLSVYSGNNGRGDMLYSTDIEFFVDLFA